MLSLKIQNDVFDLQKVDYTLSVFFSEWFPVCALSDVKFYSNLEEVEQKIYFLSSCKLSFQF